MYTRGGADSQKRTGGPLPVIMQNVQVDAGYVIEEPGIDDVHTWDGDKQGRPTRSAVFIPRFLEFSGTWGHSNMELDATLMEASFPEMASRKRFLQLVLMLLESVQGGLDRKYSSAKNSISTLLCTCDEGMPDSTGSGLGAPSGGDDKASASASCGSSARHTETGEYDLGGFQKDPNRFY